MLVPFRDRAFKFCDAVFDMTRMFDGQLFKLRDRIVRMARSLRPVQIDGGQSIEQMMARRQEVLNRNQHLREPGGDVLGRADVDLVGRDFVAQYPRYA